MRWIVMAAALLCAAGFARSCAGAATYYVAQRAANASDDNPGTEQQPWKTISKAAALLQPGDTVVVHAGVYREYVEPKNSGTARAPITYCAAPGEEVVITGADVITGWKRQPGDAPLYRIPWDHVFAIDYHNGKPVEHHPEDAPLWGRAEQVICDGKQLKPFADLAGLSKAWQTRDAALQTPVPNLGPAFAGAFFADTEHKALCLWLADSSDPNNHTMEASTRGMCFGTNPWARPQGFDYVHARGFTFRYGATFPQRAGVWLHGAHNLLEECVVEQMAGSGAAVGGTMRRCVVRGCGQTGGGAGGDGFLNEDCLWEGNCWKPISRGWDAGGFKMAMVNGGVFRRCTFRRNGGPGLWFDIHVRNVVVTECVFQENEGSGFFIEISRDITAVRNLAVGNATGVVGTVAPEAWSSAGIQLGESENCVIVNNTCVGNTDGIALREQGPRPLRTEDFGDIPYHNRDHVIVGNVCAFNQGYQLGLWYDNGYFGWHPAEKEKYKTEEAYNRFLQANPDKVYDPRAQSLLIDRNLYFAGPGQSLVLYGAPWRPKYRKFDNLAEFTSGTGFDTHSKVADPLFADAAQRDYRPKVGGPAWEMQAGWLQPPPATKK
jgi:hypothetical protein